MVKFIENLEQEFERKPTTEELAKILEISSDEVAYILQISSRQVSVDAPFNNGDENKTTLMDVLHNEEQPMPDTDLMQDSLKNEVADILIHSG